MMGKTGGRLLADDVFPAPDLKDVWLQVTPAMMQAGEFPFWGCAGWARFTRKVVLTDTKPHDETTFGELLSAEWVDEHKHSCRLEFNPRGRGQFSIFSIEESASAIAGYRRAWRETIVIEGDGPAVGRKLTYHVYLAEGDDGEVYRWSDAFRGWGTT